MCGIVGYAGGGDAAPVLMQGLKNLEYRGYDSCGVAVINGGKLLLKKAAGRLANLSKKLDSSISGKIGIGHTRWATHGEPNEINSHPHFSESGRFAVVHNGIIENYLEIKKFLSARGFNFVSQTDSEVIAHLLEYYYAGDMVSAIIKVTHRIKGSYALGMVSSYEPDAVYAVRKDSPLVIGIGKTENYIASDMPALMDFTRTFIMLGEGEIAAIAASGVRVYNGNYEQLEKDLFYADWENYNAGKDGYAHFMLKEIYEQPQAIKKTLDGTFGSRPIDGILPETLLKKLNKICIVACGSAYHAGMAGKYFIERNCRIPTEADLASEFRYRDPLIDKNTLVIIISQSGETADTLTGLRLAKSKGAFTLAVVNVTGSSIAREADGVLYTKAGPEIAVATTKGYTTQLTVLYKLGIMLGEYKGRLKGERLAELSRELELLPDKTASLLIEISKIKQLAYLYYTKPDCFFIGRGVDYALAMEGALKYKEISYIHAECYAAGELKHGTISLIEPGSLVIALATVPELAEKTMSNIKEVRARGAVVIAISSMPDVFKKECDHVVELPDGPLFPQLAAVVSAQLLSYFVASNRGCDIDKPRNLAKSVTVE